MAKKKKGIIKKTTETVSDGLGSVGGVVGGGISRVGSSINKVGSEVGKVGESVKQGVNLAVDEADKLVQQLKEGLQKIGELGSTSTDSFAAYVMEIFEVLPFIEQAGYRANYVQVGVSVPPSVEIQFERIKKLDDAAIETLLENRRNQRFFKLILNALLYASKFQEKLSIRSMTFDEISLTISIPPTISIGFHHNGAPQSAGPETITITPEQST